MIFMKNEKGQAMVEAAVSLWILFLVFVCLYSLFLTSIDKIRSLDTAYQMARAFQVKKDDPLSTTTVMTVCFGRLGFRQNNPLAPVDGVGMHEVAFQFLPHSPRTVTLPWKSIMRVVNPKIYFLDKSWPGAPTDTSSGINLASEALAAKTQLAVDNDTNADLADEALETLVAERG